MDFQGTSAMFQFHTGSIKSQSTTVTPMKEIVFQFHTGSIKSQSTTVTPMKEIVFQFHTGSIKSPNRVARTVGVICSFNSILVRLKVFCFL